MAVDESSADVETSAPPAGEPGDTESGDDGGRETLRGRVRTTALPHRHEPHGLDWNVESCTLNDERDIDVRAEGGGFFVSLLSERDWSEATLTGTITIPEDVYEYVVPEAEREASDSPPTDLNVTVDCRDAVLRESRTVASPAGPGEHPFEVTLEFDRLYGSVTLYPVLSRRKPFDGDSGPCAAETGKRLAEATSGTVEIDLTEDLYGLFQPEKKKFSEDPDFPPEDHLVHLELDGDDGPALYLNEDHEELVTVLDMRGKRGKQATLKELGYDLIEAELWPQLIVATATDVKSTGEPRLDWQWDVLRQVAEPLYGPEVGAQEAGQRLRATVESPDELTNLQMEIEDFVQSRIGGPANMTKLLKWLR